MPSDEGSGVSRPAVAFATAASAADFKPTEEDLTSISAVYTKSLQMSV